MSEYLDMAKDCVRQLEPDAARDHLAAGLTPDQTALVQLTIATALIAIAEALADIADQLGGLKESSWRREADRR
jgi:hypothetical protein